MTEQAGLNGSELETVWEKLPKRDKQFLLVLLAGAVLSVLVAAALWRFGETAVRLLVQSS